MILYFETAPKFTERKFAIPEKLIYIVGSAF